MINGLWTAVLAGKLMSSDTAAILHNVMILGEIATKLGHFLPRPHVALRGFFTRSTDTKRWILRTTA